MRNLEFTFLLGRTLTTLQDIFIKLKAYFAMEILLKNKTKHIYRKRTEYFSWGFPET